MFQKHTGLFSHDFKVDNTELRKSHCRVDMMTYLEAQHSGDKVLGQPGL